MTFSLYELSALIETWMWPFFRISGLLMSAPIIGTRTVPIKIRLVLAIALTIIIIPVIPATVYVDPFSATGMLISIQQVIIGIATGFALRVIFIVLEIAGQVVSQLMGLMLASMVDPQNGNQIPIVGQFYALLATLLFLSIDGHLLTIKVIADSFSSLPIGVIGIKGSTIWDFIIWIRVIFSAAVSIALPAIVAMLVANIAFGVMTRAAPQLNIFAVGFPFLIIFGIVVIMLTLGNFSLHVTALFDQGFMMMKSLGQ